MNNQLMTFNSVDLGISLSGMLYGANRYLMPLSWQNPPVTQIRLTR